MELDEGLNEPDGANRKDWPRENIRRWIGVWVRWADGTRWGRQIIWVTGMAGGL